MSSCPRRTRIWKELKGKGKGQVKGKGQGQVNDTEGKGDPEGKALFDELREEGRQMRLNREEGRQMRLMGPETDDDKDCPDTEEDDVTLRFGPETDDDKMGPETDDDKMGPETSTDDDKMGPEKKPWSMINHGITLVEVFAFVPDGKGKFKGRGGKGKGKGKFKGRRSNSKWADDFGEDDL